MCWHDCRKFSSFPGYSLGNANRDCWQILAGRTQAIPLGLMKIFYIQYVMLQCKNRLFTVSASFPHKKHLKQSDIFLLIKLPWVRTGSLSRIQVEYAIFWFHLQQLVPWADFIKSFRLYIPHKQSTPYCNPWNLSSCLNFPVIHSSFESEIPSFCCVRISATVLCRNWARSDKSGNKSCEGLFFFFW